MSVDAELDLWRKQWQSETEVPPDLRRKVELQTRIMKLIRIADIFVTIVMGGATTTWAVLDPQPDIILLAGATWIFIAIAWAFAIAINRGTWTPASIDTATFLNLSTKRCQSRLQAIAFGACLFICEMVFCLAWIRQHSPQPRQPLSSWLLFGSLAPDVSWLFTLTFFGFLAWYRSRKRAELAYLLEARKQLENETTMDKTH